MRALMVPGLTAPPARADPCVDAVDPAGIVME
jgi:hypothetical protein